MILYAAYIKGSLVDQVAAESEDTAHAKLKMEYPAVKDEDIVFDIVDPNFVPDENHEQTETSTSEPSGTKKVTIIEADSVHITLNISDQNISKQDIEDLQTSVEEGMVVAKQKSS